MMKTLNITFGVLFLGTLYYAYFLGNLQMEIAENTYPSFDYFNFEMAPDRKYSKTLFASIHENKMAAKVKESLDQDVWFILFYVSSTILGLILLLKNFNFNKKWVFVLIAVLGIYSGVCL